MSSGAEWAEFYARQAKADLATFMHLQTRPRRSTPLCHRWLFLQMACEKLTKAWLLRRSARPADLQSSHAYVAKNLPEIVGQQLRASGKSHGTARRLLTAAKHLSQEIEVLAPAVQRGGQRLDNCEYPWIDTSGVLHSPLDWTFDVSHLLAKPDGAIFLHAVSAAIDRLVSNDP